MPHGIALLVALAIASDAAAHVRVISRELPNGVRVVLAPGIASDKVAIHVTFDAGSRHDKRDAEGTAWLANGILGRRLADFEVGLNQERSYLAKEIPLEDLPAQLDRIVRAVANPTVTDDELRSVRDAFVAQAQGRAKEPYAASAGALLNLAYADGRGHEPEVAPTQVRKREVEQFLRDHYGTASMVVGIAGSFSEAEAMEEVRTRISSFVSRRTMRRCRTKGGGRQTEARLAISDPSATLSEVSVAYVTPDATHPDWFVLNILADIVGQGERSRLQQALVASGLAASFGEGMTESPWGSSLFRMRARVAPGVSTSQVEAVIDQHMARLAQELVSDAEMLTAREQEVAWAAAQLKSAAGVANTAARMTLFYRDPERINHEVAKMTAVTREDVRRVARRYLQKSNRVVVLTSACTRPSAPPPGWP